MNARMDRRAGWLVAAALLGGGCSEEPIERTLQIVTGHESDTFSATPAVTKIRIEAKTATGTTFAAETTPGGTFDLGEVPEDEPLGVEVTGTTAEGATVVRGRSLTGIVPGAFASADIPVFVQRVGTWARPPGGLVRAHVDAPAAVLGEQFLVTTGGSAAASADGAADVRLGDFYDLLGWGPSVTPAMPLEARTIVGRPSGMMLVGATGASAVDAGGSAYAVAWPESAGSFADVAGGLVVESPSGTSYVVGATQAGTATDEVLVVSSTGALSVLRLSAARKGAAAAWAPGVGLVVAGGSATAAGFEVLPEGGTAFAPRDMPADATEGAAAVVAGDGKMALVGGLDAMGADAKVRTWSPSCTSGCAAEEVAGAALPVGITRAQGFSLGGSRMLVVGHEATAAKLVRVFVIDRSGPSVEERPLREPRAGAAVVAAPNGTLAILGGVLEDGSPALHVETFFPD
ncbi:hypothetical protein [Polyangium mundeleinium]|uniref:Kelch-like protein n=1 Tax=Polyangium mundeleinium TaxID=2995306 RepID=A0ABT5ETX5_9BACT|nr:hypothetical protein [Polyangium mundeleinium]MDC0745279.1 hypothetical protein [Polyangium mundeleinium]